MQRHSQRLSPAQRGALPPPPPVATPPLPLLPSAPRWPRSQRTVPTRHSPNCPTVAPDEIHQRGDSDLLAANNLSNIAAHVLSGRLPAADYQSRVLCLTDWRRQGTAYDLAPLGHQFPASARPDFRPLPRPTLDAAFTLQPGGARLTEVGGVGGWFGWVG